MTPSAADHHRPYHLVSLRDHQALYATCACRREIREANLRLWRSGIPLRYVPQSRG
jgi:hypothetical protein